MPWDSACPTKHGLSVFDFAECHSTRIDAIPDQVNIVAYLRIDIEEKWC